MIGASPLISLGHGPAPARAVAGHLAARKGRRRWVALPAFVLLCSGASSFAQTVPDADATTNSTASPTVAQPRTIGGRASHSTADLCVEVDIAGYRAGHIDCATLRLQQATGDAQARAPNAETFDVPTARSADVVTGVANQTATRQRMGNQFGVGVRPQRPPPPIYGPPPMGPRKP